MPGVHGDRLGWAADGQGLLDPAAAHAVTGDTADGGAGCAPGQVLRMALASSAVGAASAAAKASCFARAEAARSSGVGVG